MKVKVTVSPTGRSNAVLVQPAAVAAAVGISSRPETLFGVTVISVPPGKNNPAGSVSLMTVSYAVIVPVLPTTTLYVAVEPACNPAAGDVSVLVSARNGSPTVIVVVDGPRVALAPPAPGSLNDIDALLPSDVLAWFDSRLSTMA